jgi:2'-5' RNA ligase
MGCHSVPVEPINQYALVTYLPDELGAFLDTLRKDIVPQCNARSHISLLPPRALSQPPEDAESHIQSVSLMAQPFVVKIGAVSIFPLTSVIYLEVEAGFHQIESLHSVLNLGPLSFPEPYPFHPHITLAQNFDLATVQERAAYARQRWAQYTGPREFLLDNVMFVQNSASNCWADLRCYHLRGIPSAIPVRVPVPSLSRRF